MQYSLLLNAPRQLYPGCTKLTRMYHEKVSVNAAKVSEPRIEAGVAAMPHCCPLGYQAETMSELWHVMDASSTALPRAPRCAVQEHEDVLKKAQCG